MKPKISRLDYCSYLLSSQTNYTLTYFADHVEGLTHDVVNRYLENEKLTPALVWEQVKASIILSPNGYLIFDDTVLDKSYSKKIALVRRQWSGNEHRIIKGIGLVNCIYVNPEMQKFWIIDYRVYDPEGDCKSKLDHVSEMLTLSIYAKQISFKTVLMDSWYATLELMRQIESLHKIYYCPIKKNRLVDETNGEQPYRAVETLNWTPEELQLGKLVKMHKFPKGHRVKLFRLTISSNRTEYVVTNDLSQNSSSAAQEECGIRWKVEEFHREIKQLTGIESCECRKSRIQRNHINCAMLVWLRLKEVAYQTKRTIYDLKNSLLDDYLIQQLKHPTIKFA